jgi:hypothetical protein
MLYEIDKCASDQTTLYKNHNVLTHLGCVSIRVALGAMIALHPNAPKYKPSIIILICAIVIVFFVKFLINMNSDTLVWKAYQRTVLSYLISLLFMTKNRTTEAGMFVMLDAIMATQSRHMAYVATHC